MKKQTIIWTAVIVCAAAALAGMKIMGGATGNGNKLPLGYAETAEAAPLESNAAAKAPIETIKPDVVVVENALRLTGSIAADQKSEVASTANGIVKEVRVDSGSLVEKGDVLVVVDPKDAENSLKEGLAGAAELRQILLTSRREEFLRCLASKLLTYALGRGLEYYDRCAVDEITRALGRGEYRFSAAILAVVNSVPFQMQRGAEPAVAAR